MDLEQRVSRLENRLALLVSIVDDASFPFIWACLDADMDRQQLDKVIVLLNKVENSLALGDPVGYSEFERELLGIVPNKRGNAEFAKSIIKALNREEKFLRPTEYFKQNGLTL